MKYSYVAKMASMSDTIQNPVFKKEMPGCDSMIVFSKQFSDFSVCEDELWRMLATLSALHESPGKYAIVTKKNPLMFEDSKQNPTDKWDKDMMLVAYLADIEALRTTKTVKFTIAGHITQVTPEVQNNYTH